MLGKITLNKILAAITVSLFALCFVNTNCFGQKSIAVGCPGATSKASVVVTRTGDIVLTPCPSKNVKLGASNLTAGGGSDDILKVAPETSVALTSFTNDPSLFANVTAGTYQFEALIFCEQETATIFRFNLTNGAAISNFKAIVESIDTDDPASNVNRSTYTTYSQGFPNDYNVAMLRYQGTVTFSSAGRLSLQYRLSSEDEATNIKAGSYLRLIKVS